MRIAVVNDLILATEAIRRVIEAASAHQVAWTARDGAEALRLCAEDRPDLILMDLIMPKMDGVEATRRIMAATPCAILVVTASVNGNFGRVYEALGAGALDAVNTPALGTSGATSGAAALLSKIDVIGRITGAAAASSWNPPVAPPAASRVFPVSAEERWLFAIGCSAGGPAALAQLLRTFPRQFPAAIVVIQHLDESFSTGLAEWLGGQIALPVRIAREDDAPEPGLVLLPGRDDHLVLTAAGRLAYTPEPADYPYRPSVDAFFESVARHWRARAAGVVLTGMGRDGAIGLKTMRDGGFPTIAQDRASSAVYGMPKAAAECGGAGQVLPLADIAPALQKLPRSVLPGRGL